MVPDQYQYLVTPNQYATMYRQVSLFLARQIYSLIIEKILDCISTWQFHNIYTIIPLYYILYAQLAGNTGI